MTGPTGARRQAPHVMVTSRIHGYPPSIASSVPFDVFRTLEAIAKQRKTTKASIIRDLVIKFVQETPPNG